MLDLSDWASKNNRATDYLFDTHLKQNYKVVGLGKQKYTKCKNVNDNNRVKTKSPLFHIVNVFTPQNS